MKKKKKKESDGLGTGKIRLMGRRGRRGRRKGTCI